MGGEEVFESGAGNVGYLKGRGLRERLWGCLKGRR